MWIVGIIAAYLAALGRLEDSNVRADVPGVRKCHLLDVKLARKAVDAMHDNAVGLALLDAEKGGGEPRAFVDAETTA